MHNRLLTVVALLSSWVIGCDDPEVEGKVADVLQYGVTAAEVKCASVTGYNLQFSACSTNFEVEVQSHLLADGSSFLGVYAYGPFGNGYQFSSRGNNPTLNTYNGAGFTNYYIDLDTGRLHYASGCDSPPETGSIELLEVNCTGRNLSAFGIDD